MASKLLSESNMKAACSVTEMTKTLGLSRARFYQLQKQGYFPLPLYCIQTRKPYYDKTLQKKCLQVRQMGIGFNNHPILFNNPRQAQPSIKKPKSDKKHPDLADALKKMGMDIGHNQLQQAINSLYPGGLDDKDEGVVIRELFRHFKQGESI